MRTYSGHSTAKASNELYRTNLAKGQTGLSIAFDLPTQTGYDPDDRMARGEVGKVGVPVAHLGHMRTLLDGIPPGEMNTSMTINATAAWLLGLYVANAEEQGVAVDGAAGHHAERHRQGVPVAAARTSSRRSRRRRLIVDMVALCAEHVPPWNPMNVCSYHLQEAGATPVQEIAYALATAIGVLDAVRDSGQVAPTSASPQVVGSISFFVNAGIRFVEETCKMRAFTEMWDRIGARALRRHRPQGPPLPLRRAGQLPRAHRGAAREQRAAHRARDARRHAVEAGPGPLRSSCRRGTRRSACPARGTSSGRCACSRCSPSRPTCSSTTTSSTARTSSRPRRPSCVDAAQAELDDVLALGGAFEAIDELKGRLVRGDGRAHAPHRVRRARSSSASTASPRPPPSPLGGDGASSRSIPAVEAETGRRRRRRGGRRATTTRWSAALDELRARRRSTARTSCRPPSTWPTPAAPPASGPRVLREVFGEYRAPTGVGRRGRRGAPATGRRRGRAGQGAWPAGRPGSSWPSPASTATPTAPSRSPSPPATPAWRSSTRASASRPSRSRRRRATRTST